jgi:hypothetical protein
MSVLVNGTDTQATGPAQVDSIVPGADLTAAVINLVAGVHRSRRYDPTANDIVLTLPAPVDGVAFLVKRVANGGNVVKITGQSIDGIAGDYVLGLENSYIWLVASAARSTYDIISVFNPAVGQLTRSTPSTSFALSTSFAKYTDWEMPGFSTPQSIVADLANDDIDLQNVRIGAAGQAGFRVNILYSFEYDNNRTVELRVVHSVDGVIGGPIAVNGLGSGKPINLSFSGPVGVSAAGDLSVEIKSEINGGTFNVLAANFITENF